MKDSIRPLMQPHLTGLPRGPHGLARELVTGSQRQRLLYAMTVVVAEKGYIATTVAHVTTRAGVSRKTFYEMFADKEECFIAAADTGRELMVKRLEASFARSSAQALMVIAGTKNNSRIGNTAFNWSRFARLLAKNWGLNARNDPSATKATMNR